MKTYLHMPNLTWPLGLYMFLPYFNFLPFIPWESRSATYLKAVHQIEILPILSVTIDQQITQIQLTNLKEISRYE